MAKIEIRQRKRVLEFSYKLLNSQLNCIVGQFFLVWVVFYDYLVQTVQCMLTSIEVNLKQSYFVKGDLDRVNAVLGLISPYVLNSIKSR